jgi:pimeloyl-ACP methyl ester carboxylesterase
MATFILVPGAGGTAWTWHRLTPLLAARGHHSVAVDIPIADPTAGLDKYADVVSAAVDSAPRSDATVIVALSMAGFYTPQVCAHGRVDLLVLLNAMVPLPHETPGDWFTDTGHAEARAEDAVRLGLPSDREFDVMVDFFHDVPADVTAEAFSQPPPQQADKPFGDQWLLERWPEVPIRVIAGREDRFFPLAFQRRIARERLGIELDELPGGHLLPLSQPASLANRLDDYWRALRA